MSSFNNIALSNANMYRGADALPDPFMDIASLSMPSTMVDCLKWCERIFERMGVYRSAVERIIAYFITDIQIDGIDRKEKDKYLDFFYDELNIKSLLIDVSLDYFFYGNSFTSPLIPIKRYLYCPYCALERPLSEIATRSEFSYTWSGYKFQVTCPRCQRRDAWQVNDRRAASGPQLIMKRWSPHEIELSFDPYTEKTHYIWKIPPDYADQIRRGELQVLETANWEIIEAVRDRRWIRFDDGFVYHMKEHRLAGQQNRGWGISKALTNFGLAYYVQMLHRYNEALALDYVVPFRVITPELKGGPIETEPAFKLGISTFVNRVSGMVRSRRSDPTKWNILPFPIRYQALGGDATAFTPRELLEQGYDVMFNSIGCPIEFYRGSISTQSLLPALRIFEAHHQPYRDQLVDFLGFVADSVSARKEWDPIQPSMLKPRYADDITRQQMQLQLGLNQQISQTTALRAIDLEFEEEQRRKMEEQQIEAELSAEAQEEMDQQASAQQLFPPLGASTLAAQQQQQQGAAQPPGAGAPSQAQGISASSGMPMNIGQARTPEEYTAQAGQIAQSLLMIPDDATRKSQLAQIKQQDPVLQLMVLDQLKQQRKQLRTQGGQMLMQQMGSGAPPSQ